MLNLMCWNGPTNCNFLCIFRFWIMSKSFRSLRRKTRSFARCWWKIWTYHPASSKPVTQVDIHHHLKIVPVTQIDRDRHVKIVLIAAEKKEKDRRKFVCYFRRDSEFKQLTTKNLTDPCLVRGLKIWFGITNPAVQNHPQECARKIG